MISQIRDPPEAEVQAEDSENLDLDLDLCACWAHTIFLIKERTNELRSSAAQQH